MLDTKDEAHDLDVELSENNMRRNFTGSELAEGIRRQTAIEQEKAKGRMIAGKAQDPSETFPKGRASDAAGAAFGISGKQAEKVMFVDEHRDLLDPADFAEWDEGKLSTNKAYQRIKAAQKKAERERDAANDALEDAYRTQEALEDEIEALKRQPKPEPEVIERTVEVEVESQESKRRIAELERLERLHNDDYQRLRKRNEEMRKELDKAKDILGMDKTMQDVRRDVQYLIASTNQYVRHYGGLTWTAESLTDVDGSTIEELRKSVRNLATFANTLMNFLEEINGNN
jgi:chromosome segregation ATPase